MTSEVINYCNDFSKNIYTNSNYCEHKIMDFSGWFFKRNLNYQKKVKQDTLEFV
jgi:hypothetical protein